MVSPLKVYCILAFLGFNFYAIVAIGDSAKVNLIFGFKNGSVTAMRSDLRGNTMVTMDIEFENEVTALLRYEDQLFVSTKSSDKDKTSLIFVCQLGQINSPSKLHYSDVCDEFKKVEPKGEYALSMVVTPQGYLFVGCTNGYLLRCPMDFSTEKKCEIFNDAGRGAHITGIAHDSLHDRIFAALNYGLLWSCSLYETHSCETYYKTDQELTTLTISEGFIWLGTRGSFSHNSENYLRRCPIVDPAKEKDIKNCEFYPKSAHLKYSFSGKKSYKNNSRVYSVGQVDGRMNVCDCNCNELDFEMDGAETSVILV